MEAGPGNLARGLRVWWDFPEKPVDGQRFGGPGLERVVSLGTEESESETRAAGCWLCSGREA